MIPVVEQQLQRESALQHLILKYLNTRGFPAWLTHDSRHYPIEKGIADINCVLPDGRFLAIECKRKDERLSPDQELWLSDIVRSGGKICLARCLEDVANMLNGINSSDEKTVTKGRAR